jgi:hypothetical protein
MLAMTLRLEPTRYPEARPRGLRFFCAWSESLSPELRALVFGWFVAFRRSWE